MTWLWCAVQEATPTPTRLATPPSRSKTSRPVGAKLQGSRLNSWLFGRIHVKRHLDFFTQLLSLVFRKAIQKNNRVKRHKALSGLPPASRLTPARKAAQSSPASARDFFAAEQQAAVSKVLAQCQAFGSCRPWNRGSPPAQCPTGQISSTSFASENGQITGGSPAVPPPAPSTSAQTSGTTPNAVYKAWPSANNGTQLPLCRQLPQRVARSTLATRVFFFSRRPPSPVVHRPRYPRTENSRPSSTSRISAASSSSRTQARRHAA